MTNGKEFDPEAEERPPDPAVEIAIGRLQAFFEASPKQLFHSIRIQTALEREFFHWITGKALLELASSRAIQRSTVTIAGNPVNFYAHLRHRYWLRERRTMVDILTRLYDPEFAHAVGRHGELMFDAALGRAGFRGETQNSNSWKGKTWDQTSHNFDRIFTRDGLAYAAEIKNTQNYISREELRIKLQMAHHLELIPLFIVRFAPKSYIHEIVQEGGFALLFEEQLYPLGQSTLLHQARDVLGLKVGSPKDIKDGDVQRFLRWHERKLRRR